MGGMGDVWCRVTLSLWVRVLVRTRSNRRTSKVRTATSHATPTPAHYVVRAQAPTLYNTRTCLTVFLTTLAFWLRSSVVSVLNSLTTIMGAQLPLLVI